MYFISLIKNNILCDFSNLYESECKFAKIDKNHTVRCINQAFFVVSFSYIYFWQHPVYIFDNQFHKEMQAAQAKPLLACIFSPVLTIVYLESAKETFLVHVSILLFVTVIQVN